MSGITKFGAFVALPDGRSGLVHISEVANAFVSDVSEHVQMGQMVKVRVLGVSPEGKINLSIKRAADNPPAERPGFRRPAPTRSEAPRPARSEAPREAAFAADPPSADQAFEDRLKRFMQESDSRIADNRLYADRSRGRRRR